MTFRNSLKEHSLLLLIFVAGLLLRLYMSRVDPFLHDWDERFHALVAKNMISHPLKPMLYTHQYFSTDKFNWTYNHIWLHKQPLFLWQMALSMKLFGISEFALRLPSVIMGSLMILLTYRLCRLSTSNKWTALLASLLVCCSHFYLNLVSGREGMDHNDIAFGFYVLASLWAYAEYLRTSLWKWAILIGVFAGCAVLNKWLTGLLVFAPWSVQLIINIIRARKWKDVWPFLIALATCTIIFLPWQLYILTHFHELAAYEYAYNTRHILEVVENHGGDIWFYLNKFPEYFGEQTNYLVPVGLIILYFSKSVRIQHKLLLIVPVVVTFCFFSFIVQTKIDTYFFIVAPLCLIYSAITLHSLIHLFGRFKMYAGIPILALSIYFTLDFEEINAYTKDTGYRQSKVYNTAIYKQLDKIIPANIKVLLNANCQDNVEIMFYSSRLEVYHSHIPEQEFKAVTQSGLPVAAFASRDNNLLDDYVRNYKNLYIVTLALK